MLKNSSFLPPPEADLSDLDKYVYPASPQYPVIITEREALQAVKLKKAPGLGITNGVL